jgi:hypothetical protein
MAKDRKAKANLFLAEIGPFLKDNRIALRSKLMVISACLVPKMIYGCEVWGMSEVRCQPFQRIVNRAIRMATRVGVWAPLKLVQDDLRILPIHVAAASRRARLLFKAQSGVMKTFLSEVIVAPFKTRKKTWLTESLIWLKRWLREADTDATAITSTIASTDAGTDAGAQVRTGTMIGTTSTRYWITCNKNKDSPKDLMWRKVKRDWGARPRQGNLDANHNQNIFIPYYGELVGGIKGIETLQHQPTTTPAPDESRAKGLTRESDSGRMKTTMLRNVMLDSWRRKDRSVGWANFDKWELRKTTLLWLLVQEEFPELNWAVEVIIQMRWGAIWWTRRLKKVFPQSFGEEEFELRCLACGCLEGEEEGLNHYFLRCFRWDKWRKEYIIPALEELGYQMGPELDAYILLGGQCDDKGDSGTSIDDYVRWQKLNWPVLVAQFVSKTWGLRAEEWKRRHRTTVQPEADTDATVDGRRVDIWHGRSSPCETWHGLKSPSQNVPPRGEAMMGMPAAIAGALRVELEESKQVGGAKSLIQ